VSSDGSKDDSPDTRTRILTAAWELLSENADPSMGEIAGRAGVSRQAVYLHFDNRAELLMAVADWANGRVGLPERVAWAQQATTSREQLRRFLHVVVWLVERTQPGILALHRAVDADPAVADTWQSRQGRASHAMKVVTALRDEGRLRADLSTAQGAALLRALTRPTVVADLLEAGLSRTKTTAILHRAADAALGRDET
jgi:AcrR family transcriptional regulator